MRSTSSTTAAELGRQIRTSRRRSPRRRRAWHDLPPPPTTLPRSICGVIGWFWPDFALRNQQQQTNADAEEALNTLFDLVVLERLANMSATQAMAAAARLSDVPVFVHIRGALERARLEQRPPWTDLHRLSRELELPSIADMADVMRLDDQGAALAGVLTARVKELRDAHLTRERVRAHQASEAMTLWMSIPVVVFALAFLIPPLLTMSGAA